MALQLILFQHISCVPRCASQCVQVQSAGKRRQQAAGNMSGEAIVHSSFGPMLFNEAEGGEAGNHPWSWVRDYQRPPSRQLPPELALFLDNHPDDSNSPISRQQSPHNGSDAGSFPCPFYFAFVLAHLTSLLQAARVKQPVAAL